MGEILHIVRHKQLSSRSSYQKNRHFLLSIQNGGVGTAAMDPSPDTCVNPPDGSFCQPTPSTFIVMVSAMCFLLLLVVVVVVVLFCVHLRHGQEERHLQQDARVGNEGAVPAAPVEPASSNREEKMVLVLFPSEKDPVAFARPSPFQEDESKPNMTSEC